MYHACVCYASQKEEDSFVTGGAATTFFYRVVRNRPVRTRTRPNWPGSRPTLGPSVGEPAAGEGAILLLRFFFAVRYPLG